MECHELPEQVLDNSDVRKSIVEAARSAMGRLVLKRIGSKRAGWDKLRIGAEIIRPKRFKTASAIC